MIVKYHTCKDWVDNKIKKISCQCGLSCKGIRIAAIAIIIAIVAIAI